MKRILALLLLLLTAFAAHGQSANSRSQQASSPTNQLYNLQTSDSAVAQGVAPANEPAGVQAPAPPHSYDFQTIDFPGATFTQAYGLNNCGDVVGIYVDAQGLDHGFSYSQKDGFKTIDVPNAVQIGVFGVNDARHIVGGWIDNSGILHGFVLTGSKLTQLDFPGGVDTVANGINAQGDIVGGYDTGDRAESIGFLLKKGHYTALQDPVAAPSQTGPSGINNNGQIVGEYGDSTGVAHGFLLQQGKYSTIDFPGADLGSFANGINSGGQVSGCYFTDTGYVQGYLLSRGGYTPLVFPGATVTCAQGINDQGQIAGYFRATSDGPFHGFIASPGKNGAH